jgi:hypothetical protein
MVKISECRALPSYSFDLNLRIIFARLKQQNVATHQLTKSAIVEVAVNYRMCD